MGNLAIEANGKVFKSTYQDSGVIKKNKDKNKLKEKTNNSVMVESKPTSQADTASRKKM